MSASSTDAEARKARPLSPHLQIYKLGITGLPSIMHRMTGAANAVGTLLLIYWLTSAAAGPEAYESAIGFIGSVFGRLILFGWTISVFYHLCNGIRHLFWDMGIGLTMARVQASVVTVIVAALLLTVLTWAGAYFMPVG